MTKHPPTAENHGKQESISCALSPVGTYTCQMSQSAFITRKN